MADTYTGEASEGKSTLPGGAFRSQEGKSNLGTWNPLIDLTELYPGNRGMTKEGTFGLYDAPIGVELKIEKALKSDPVIIGENEWDSGEGHAVKAWEENGKFHMLYSSQVGICYANSSDGYNWVRPELGLIDFNGSKRNSLVTPEGGDRFKAVFEDPLAPPEEKFKAMGCEGFWVDPDTAEILSSEEGARRMEAQAYGGQSYDGPKLQLRGWVVGYTSPDRIHWNKLEEPIGNFPMDGGLSASYDADTGFYFAYCRIHGLSPEDLQGIGSGAPETAVVRRAIGLTKTKDFRNWPPPKLLLFPDGQDDLDVSFYGSDYFPYPGRTDLHCQLIQMYHQIIDSVDSQIAFSRDGIVWSRPERKAIIPLGIPGSGDDCMVYSWGSGIVELPDGYWGSLYGGSSKLHNVSANEADEIFPDKRPFQIRWAKWLPHRFCGVEAQNEGQFTIPVILRTNSELRLNYRCAPGGWIKVELLNTIPSRLHPDAPGPTGFGFEDCDTLVGDSLSKIVTWNGKSDISGIGDTVAIRIRMFQAKVFAYLV